MKLITDLWAVIKGIFDYYNGSWTKLGFNIILVFTFLLLANVIYFNYRLWTDPNFSKAVWYEYDLDEELKRLSEVKGALYVMMEQYNGSRSQVFLFHNQTASAYNTHFNYVSVYAEATQRTVEPVSSIYGNFETSRITDLEALIAGRCSAFAPLHSVSNAKFVIRCPLFTTDGSLQGYTTIAYLYDPQFSPEEINDIWETMKIYNNNIAEILVYNYS